MLFVSVAELRSQAQSAAGESVFHVILALGVLVTLTWLAVNFLQHYLTLTPLLKKLYFWEERCGAISDRRFKSGLFTNGLFGRLEGTSNILLKSRIWMGMAMPFGVLGAWAALIFFEVAWGRGGDPSVALHEVMQRVRLAQS